MICGILASIIYFFTYITWRCILAQKKQPILQPVEQKEYPSLPKNCLVGVITSSRFPEPKAGYEPSGWLSLAAMQGLRCPVENEAFLPAKGQVVVLRISDSKFPYITGWGYLGSPLTYDSPFVIDWIWLEETTDMVVA